MDFIKTDVFLKDAGLKYKLVVLGVSLPVFIALFFHWFYWSEIIEEIIKSLVIVFVVIKLSSNKLKLLWASIFGFLFGFSEAVLYSAEYVASGNFSDIWIRFFSAVPMHTLTAFLIVFFIVLFRKKRMVFLGFSVALTIHILFNHMIAVFW